MKKKLLFTPGPLTTQQSVKGKMLQDMGSRDSEFIEIVREIRESLLQLGGVKKAEGYECILMQGSGTFGIESVISSVAAETDKLLILVNGAYGKRIATMAGIHGIHYHVLESPENSQPDPALLDNYLREHKDISHVVLVHCETTTGIINELPKISPVVKRHRKTFILDAMSSFGAVNVNMKKEGIDFLISSSNKCIEGVPGFSFILAEKTELLKSEGKARSLSLDLFAQWKGLEQNGQFRFTPPVQVLLAFQEALKELKAEGGVEARGKRYAENNRILLEGMSKMGFEMYLDPRDAGYIITTFLYPSHKAFDFELFYQLLNKKGQVIYPGKLSEANCFRIGNIGQIFAKDIEHFLEVVKEVKEEMGF